MKVLRESLTLILLKGRLFFLGLGIHRVMVIFGLNSKEVCFSDGIRALCTGSSQKILPYKDQTNGRLLSVRVS